MKRITSILLIVLSIFGCQKSNNESILFSSSRAGNSDIYLMSVGDLNATQITNSGSEEWGPTWINQNEISFLRQNKDKITRYKLNLTTLEEFTIEHPENCVLDDKNMLYSSSGELQLYSCKSDIFLLNINAGETVNLTKGLNGISAYPSWSFDSKQIIFTNDQTGNNDIYMIDLKTKKITQLTNFDSNDERGELSPNKEFLVFSSDKFNAGNQDIVIKNMVTNSLENITDGNGTELIARWSSDGKSLYFGSNKDDNWELYIYNIENKSTKRITNNKEFDGDPRILKK